MSNERLSDPWVKARELAMRDFSQDASLHEGAPTALGTKSQPAGGMPLTPSASPVSAHVMGSPEDAEQAVRFGFDAARSAGPSGSDWNTSVEEQLRVNWSQARRQRADFEEVLPFVRHGYHFGRRWGRGG